MDAARHADAYPIRQSILHREEALGAQFITWPAIVSGASIASRCLQITEARESEATDS